MFERLAEWKQNKGGPLLMDSSFIPRSVVVSLQYKWKVITASNWSGISQASLCLAIRVIVCLDTLSGGIISLWLQPQLGSDPGAK